MNKNAIQKFAIWARNELIAQVSQRAYQYGIDESGFGDASADTLNGRLLTAEEKSQRQELIKQIKEKGCKQVMEEVAYTWFNRFIALRFMEVNNYLPSHIRVFSDASGAFKPEILNDVLHLDLPGLDSGKVAEYIESNDTEALYRYLLLTQCNALNSALPVMFERMGGYTEMLLPNNILRQDSVLGHMADYAACFAETFRPDSCERSIPSAYGMERMNVIIFGLKNTTVIPYVLYVAKEIQNPDSRNEIFAVLESYIMRRMIVRATTKNSNNLFASLILNNVLDAAMLKERLSRSGDVTTYFPDDRELLQGFKESKLINLQSKGVLYMMESAIQPANAAMVLLGFKGYSLEHLMPKKWRNNWAPCETEELAKERDSCLLTLGNLAIIPQPLNASIRDANWTVKKAGKGTANPGLELCASGLLTIHDVLKEPEWTEEKIGARADWLFEQAKRIWQA